MFTTAPAKSFPPLDDLVEFLSSIDYKLHLTKFILVCATIAATVVGVTTFVYRNARKFWLAHGDDIILGFYEFVNYVEIAIERVYEFGVICRPVANFWVAKFADRAFYFACEVA